MLQVSKETESRTNSEADYPSSGSDQIVTLGSLICVDLIHRKNQTAHISLQILAISNSVETKSTGCALFFLARPASVTSKFFASLPSGASLRRSVWRSVVRLSAAGEGVFTYWAGEPQALFLRNVIFF